MNFGMPKTVIRQLICEMGDIMAKKKSITRISDKKRGRPKIRFSIWGLLLIFFFSFFTVFALYMVAANFNDDFFSESIENIVIEEKNERDSSGKDGEGSGDDANGSSAAITNPISQSEAKGATYFNDCCLVTDATLIDMAKYTDFKDVISSTELSAVGCNTVTIESSYGVKTAYETLQIKKPSKVYIMLGSDISESAMDEMISSYTTFVKNLRGYLVDADIYIMQLPPVSDDDPNVSNASVNEFNTKLLTIANTNNVYCIDTNTALKGIDGKISEGFRDPQTGLLTASAYKTIADYILCHTV